MTIILKGPKTELTLWTRVVLDQDLGQQPKEEKFKTTWKRLGKAERQADVEALASGDISEAELITKYLVNWEKLTDTNDEEVPYGEEGALEALLDSFEYADALAESLMIALTSKEYWKRKNS